MRKSVLSLFEGEYELLNKSKKGVYSIYFVGTGWFYIGSTSCKEGFYHRWREHLGDLRRNKHPNTILQRIYNKYGEAPLKLKIIEICEDNKEFILEREQFFIDSYNPSINVNKVAKGCEFPEDWISPTAKALLQYDLKGNFLKEYKSINEAKIETGADIMQSLRREGLSSRAGSFQWRLKEEDDIPMKISEYKRTQEKPILCYDSNGNFYKEFDSLRKASIELGLNCGNISKAITGKIRSCNGYFFKEKESDNFPLFIDDMLRLHKNQMMVSIEDLQTKKCFQFNSLREIPKDIINRCSFRPYQRKGLSEFEIKKRGTDKKYRVKIQSYNKA